MKTWFSFLFLLSQLPMVYPGGFAWSDTNSKNVQLNHIRECKARLQWVQMTPPLESLEPRHPCNYMKQHSCLTHSPSTINLEYMVATVPPHFLTDMLSSLLSGAQNWLLSRSKMPRPKLPLKFRMAMWYGSGRWEGSQSLLGASGAGLLLLMWRGRCWWLRSSLRASYRRRQMQWPPGNHQKQAWRQEPWYGGHSKKMERVWVPDDIFEQPNLHQKLPTSGPLDI